MVIFFWIAFSMCQIVFTLGYAQIQVWFCSKFRCFVRLQILQSKFLPNSLLYLPDYGHVIYLRKSK